MYDNKPNHVVSVCYLAPQTAAIITVFSARLMPAVGSIVFERSLSVSPLSFPRCSLMDQTQSSQRDHCLSTQRSLNKNEANNNGSGKSIQLS